MLFCGWRYGGEDPWRTRNMLDHDYRPLHAAERAPVRPRNPHRYRAFMYACAKVAAILDGKMSDTSGRRAGAR